MQNILPFWHRFFRAFLTFSKGYFLPFQMKFLKYQWTICKWYLTPCIIVVIYTSRSHIHIYVLPADSVYSLATESDFTRHPHANYHEWNSRQYLCHANRKPYITINQVDLNEINTIILSYCLCVVGWNDLKHFYILELFFRTMTALCVSTISK